MSGPVTWRGFTFDPSTVSKLELTEKWVGVPLRFAQGSYSNGSRSGGTHAGGGAVDVECIGDTTMLKAKKVHYLRACVGPAWHRPPNWDGAGGSEHIHCLEAGNPNLSPAARAQITQWNQGDNGLANHNPDSEAIDQAAGRPARITAPPPPPLSIPPVHHTRKAPRMVILAVTRNSVPPSIGWPGDFLLTDNGDVIHILSTDDLKTLTDAGVPGPIGITYSALQSLTTHK